MLGLVRPAMTLLKVVLNAFDARFEVKGFLAATGLSVLQLALALNEKDDTVSTKVAMKSASCGQLENFM